MEILHVQSELLRAACRALNNLGLLCVEIAEFGEVADAIAGMSFIVRIPMLDAGLGRLEWKGEGFRVWGIV